MVISPELLSLCRDYGIEVPGNPRDLVSALPAIIDAVWANQARIDRVFGVVKKAIQKKARLMSKFHPPAIPNEGIIRAETLEPVVGDSGPVSLDSIFPADLTE
jgi:hypothetical protein